MGPNALLARIRFLTDAVLNELDASMRLELADELANQVENLDEWISRGGFLPSDWER